MSVKTIFITGASGALGSSIVPLLLDLQPSRIYILLRAKSPQQLKERLNELLAYWDLKAENSSIISVQGDITEEGFGINSGLLEEIIQSTTHIIHSAATVKMNMTEQEAQQSSVRSTENMLKIASSGLQKGVLQKIEYVSTVGIAGKMRGSVPETPITTPREFHNTYESSKTKAEELVLQKINAGWPITIHRPSMVVGDSKTGKTIHFQIFYYFTDFLTGKHTGGFFPIIENVKLDTIPSDYVARIIVWSMQESSAIGKIFHSTSGPKEAIVVHELAKKVQNFYKDKKYGLPAPKPVSVKVFKLALYMFKLFAGPKKKKRLETIAMFLEFLDDSQVFENTKTRDVLDKAGIALPPVNSYLENVLDFYHAKKHVR